MLLLATAIKLVCEIALCALAGQWLLGLMAGAKRDQNFFYQMLGILTRPFTRAFRVITPRSVIDRYLPLLTFFGLAWIWLFALIEKASLCRGSIGQGLCQ